ncbi:MAG: DinB family protein [Phycisphaerales bacterium]|jgi:hypothetical protein
MTNTRGDLLAHNIMNSQALFERFFVGFDDSNRTTQAPSLPNHLAWTLGHLALTAQRGAHRVLGHDDPQPLPEAAFVAADRGSTAHFAIESVSFGSTPVDDPTAYPTLDSAVQIMHDAHESLAGALRGASDAALDRPTPWGDSSISVSDLALRMGFHIATHAGQITDLRRALGLGSILKPGLSKPKGSTR